MKKSSIIWILIIVVIVVIAAWYWSSQSNSTNPPVATTTPPAATTPSTVVLEAASTTQLGTFLVAANGMTLYEYTKDTPGTSNCSGQCAVAWPPYTVPAGEASSSFGGGPGVNGSIGAITRSDGSLQFTYNNMPLYFYSKDVNVGDTNGQNVGGVWFVVSP